MKSFVLSAAMLAATVLYAGKVDMQKINDAKLFDVDYRKLHYSGHADAQFAKGSPKGTILHQSKPRYDVEAMESINRGLLVGKDSASVRYLSAGNLNPRQGTIEISFTNYEWDFNSKGVYILLQAVGKDTTLYIYKHDLDGVGAYIGNDKPKWSVFPRQISKKITGRTAHHLVVTYSTESVQCYLDGLLVRDMKIQSPISDWHKYFEIGPAGKFGRDGRTTIAFVSTYNRPLTAEEVLTLAALRVPSLKLENAKVIKTENIPSSTFLKNPGTHGIEALDDNAVPSPFQPVKLVGNTLQVWNRSYDFSGGDLVTQITTPDGKLLRDGVNLLVTKDGKTEKILFEKTVKLTLDGKGRKSFSRNVVSPAYLSGKISTTVEYDGAVDFVLDIKGLSKLQRLTLSGSMTADYSDTVHYVGTNGMNMRSVVAPDASYSHSLKNQPGTVFTRNFLPHIWLGSHKGGLQIYHNYDKPFYPKDRNDCFQIQRNAAGESDLLISYATEKYPVDSLSFRFGLIATPVRPLPANWRAWNFSAQYTSFVGNRRGSHLIYWSDVWKERIMLDPDPNRALDKETNRNILKLDRADNRYVIPYFDHRHVGSRTGNLVNPDAEYMMEHWGPIPQRKPSGSDREYIRVSSDTGFTDYLARCVYEWSRIMGTIDGVYIDEMECVPNIREESKGGYVSFDVSRRFTHAIYGDRNMYKRLDAVVRAQNGGKMPMSIAHCSGTHMMEILSAFPIFLTAEHLYSGYFPDNKELIPPEHDRLYYYSYALPMDRVKSEFYHRPWGAVIVFLPCMKNQRDIMKKVEPTRDLLSRAMHADLLFWPLWCNADEMYKVEDFRRKWDIGNAAVKFVPYWENKELLSDTPETCISFYDKNGEKLAIVSNLARVGQNVVVKLPAGTKQVINAETEQEISIKSGTVTIPMKRNDYCALIIKR